MCFTWLQHSDTDPAYSQGYSVLCKELISAALFCLRVQMGLFHTYTDIEHFNFRCVKSKQLEITTVIIF